MKGRPHTSPECRCDACARYDREQEDAQWPYVWWDKHDELRSLHYNEIQTAYAAERAAWQALVDMYDEVFRDDSRDDS